LSHDLRHDERDLAVIADADEGRWGSRSIIGFRTEFKRSVPSVWTGITLAFYTDWPASFWITALSAGAYGLTALPRIGKG
jgi:hypothetical protein